MAPPNLLDLQTAISPKGTYVNSPSSLSASEHLWNALQAAELLGVSERWVRDHATRRSPKIPVVKLGPLLRFRPTDVQQFIESQRDDHSGASRRH